MIFFFLRRLIGAISTLFLLATFTFFLIRLAPGGPFDQNQTWPAEVYQEILHQYELDQPLMIQYEHWLQSFLHIQTQHSLHYLGTPVFTLIADSLPTSLFLGSLALLLTLLCGLLLGCLSAMPLPTIIRYLTWAGIFSCLTLPNYILGGILILLFSLHLHWLPAALWQGPTSWLLPTLMLAWRPIGLLAQMTHLSIQEELTQNYVRTAWGKGAPPRLIFFKHILKNSALPILGGMGPTLAHVVAGSFLVETFFQVPGMGHHLVQAVLNRDYPLVTGTALTYGAILLFCHLITDLISLHIDPRLKEEL